MSAPTMMPALNLAMTQLTSQHISAVTGTIIFLAFVVYVVAGMHFYYRKLDHAIALTRHPWAKGRTRAELSLHEKMNICTSLAVWLAFPHAKRWPISKNNAMFHPVDARQIPVAIKIPLFLAYGGLITIVLALIIGGALRNFYA